jgi:radical SAM superfamily enzyme YgiQ (UPF0313 family)
MRAPEGLIIRPPSEAESMLLRVVRGCHWNKCGFCGIYDLYGQDFETRPLEDVLEDVELLKADWGNTARTAFLGDADPLERPVSFLVPVLDRLRGRFPSLERVTSYARASSVNKKSADELKELARHGLDRIHVGLESGSDAVLRFQRKGASRRILIEAGKKIHEAGIELSFYVLLGLGGRDQWEEHAVETAHVINETVPQFVRVRRLWIHPMSRLAGEVESGNFREQTPEGTVRELRRMIEEISVDGPFLTCDHANNYLPVHGRFLKDKAAMLDAADAFLGLTPEARERHYRAVGSVI